MPRTRRDPSIVPYFQVSGVSSTRDCFVCLLCSAGFLAAAFQAILRRPICPATRLVRCPASFPSCTVCWAAGIAEKRQCRRRGAPPGDILTWLFRLVFASHMRRSRPITPRTAARTEETTSLSLPRTTGTWRLAISRSTRRCRRRRGERRELAHDSLLTNSCILPPHLPGSSFATRCALCSVTRRKPAAPMIGAYLFIITQPQFPKIGSVITPKDNEEEVTGEAPLRDCDME